MVRIICLVIGYIFGLFQTGYIYGKLYKVDIRTMGSGNAGTTNALRTMGWKAGAITFIGDAFKCIFAVLTVTLLFGESHAEMIPMLKMYAGMGAVLGHNYPFYLKFKGGKGIAATAGLLAATTNLPMTLIVLVAFVIAVAITKYVSVGSLVGVTIYMLEIIICGQMGGFGIAQGYLYEMYAIAVLLLISAVYKHKPNIQRLMNGTENKLSVGKSKKN
ncbi:MAG: glycerol-3-phosphate 1-O-acyltransferase PlsY [Dorea sp.]